MNTTPKQLQAWREEFEKTEWSTELKRNPSGYYANNYIEGVWQGYLRAKQETEQIMKLAKFGAEVLANTQFTYQEVRDLAIQHGVANLSGDNWQAIKELLT